MLRFFKYFLLVPVVVLLGFIVAEKLDLAGTAHHIMGVDAAAAGAVPNPDWHPSTPLAAVIALTSAPVSLPDFSRNSSRSKADG